MRAKPYYVLHNPVMIAVTFVEIPERNYGEIWVEGLQAFMEAPCVGIMRGGWIELLPQCLTYYLQPSGIDLRNSALFVMIMLQVLW